MANPITSLRIEHITKRFPGIIANDDVTFCIKPGEIHALLGENGAVTISLGKRILRCETAAVSAITLAMYNMGEME